MTPSEAVGFLTQAAWKNHELVTTGDARSMMGYNSEKSCRAWVITGPDKAKLGDEKKCNCGAVQHNARVREALLTIGKAAARNVGKK